MAQKKKTNNKANILQSLKEQWNNIIHIAQNEKAYFIVGALLVLLMLYLCILLISFFFTGAADQSVVGHLRFTELGSVAKGDVHNWNGAFGAWLSNIIMNKWFGVSSLLLAFYGLLAGLRLMRVRVSKLGKGFVYSAFLFIWISIFFGFIFAGQPQLLFLGGAHGYHISQWLNVKIGIPGTVIVLFFSMLVFLIFAIQNTIPFIRKSLQFNLSDKAKAQARKVKEFITDEKDEKDEDEFIETESISDENENNNLSEDYFINEEPAENEGVIYAEDIDREIDENFSENPLEDEFIENDIEISPVDNSDISISVEVAKAEDEADKAEENIHISQSKGEYDALAELGEYDPKAELHSFKNPPVRLLKDYGDSNPVINQEEQKENQNKIIEVLSNFGISIQSIHGTVGPTVTLYEVVPAAGVRIAKIRNLENDIALSLAALGIRIIAPIPGKGTIGIEVPRRDPSIVSMKGLIMSKKFQESKYDLPIVLGKTIMNEVFCFDLCKTPHLLVAGATGQGKSVGLNALITSLLYKKHPSELKIVLVDPKMVEFSIYSSIEKHYLAKVPGDDPAIITESDKVKITLNSLCIEMDDRYDLLSKAKCRNIKEYNEKFKLRKLNPEKGHRFLPYIVIIIDEFGDLIMTAGKEIEMPIARIAQKARAVGMHMVIATQRPTTNIITGTIKANFPARLSFRVSSMTDSRTILDASGAQQLIGKGDALYLSGSELTRIQCAFVDTPEVEDVVNFIGDQRGYPGAFELPEYTPDNGAADSGGSKADLSSRDSFFEQAARMVVTTQQGSTSYLQRKLGLGYNRAGRIMDQLEAAGIVGPAEGSKPRQVLVDTEAHLDQILSGL
ncbi:MAG: DNA translocase FtsK [Bacteroidales bacterium]|nr:DNA translocase FtsK [Bacteroidales bacterium]